METVRDANHEAQALDGAAAVFNRSSRKLFGIANRILRDPSAAQDVVQDAWIRWQATDRAAVINSEAFLVTTTTRLALNEAQSARHRREIATGSWVTQATETEAGPESGALQTEAFAEAVFVLLTKLGPPERAAYVLRHAFDYPYDLIAELLQLSNANCRQLVVRAGGHVRSERRLPVSVTTHRLMFRALLAATRDGEFAELEHLLVDAVRAQSSSR